MPPADRQEEQVARLQLDVDDLDALELGELLVVRVLEVDGREAVDVVVDVRRLERATIFTRLRPRTCAMKLFVRSWWIGVSTPFGPYQKKPSLGSFVR